MKYDFTTHLDRHGKDAIAVDAPFGPGSMLGEVGPREGVEAIPMWVADMNFATVPTIPQAMAERALHPAYGYFMPKPEYFQCVIDWHKDRNGVTGLEPKHIGYENGVLGGVISALRVIADQGAPVLLHSPTYIGFTHCIGDNGFNIIHSPLKLDENGVWRMDYEDMDAKLKQYHIHAAVLCSPHNPCGRVWERWELEKAMEVYAANNCYVVSDEIWSDLILPGHTHIPTQSISEDAKQRTIALYAPSKTFNLAGLVGSYRIVYNDYLRERMDKYEANTHYNSPNVMSMHALTAAYTAEGRQWVDELVQVLDENVQYACDFIKAHFEGVELARPEGTYMLFLDCTKWCAAHGKTIGELQDEGRRAGVIWQDGRAFHGPCHIRMNLALPKDLVVEAFDRLDREVFNGNW